MFTLVLGAFWRGDGRQSITRDFADGRQAFAHLPTAQYRVTLYPTIGDRTDPTFILMRIIFTATKDLNTAFYSSNFVIDLQEYLYKSSYDWLYF